MIGGYSAYQYEAYYSSELNLASLGAGIAPTAIPELTPQQVISGLGRSRMPITDVSHEPAWVSRLAQNGIVNRLAIAGVEAQLGIEHVLKGTPVNLEGSSLLDYFNYNVGMAIGLGIEFASFEVVGALWAESALSAKSAELISKVSGLWSKELPEPQFEVFINNLRAESLRGAIV